MRSKTKVIQKPVTSGNPRDFPDWSFDGSSTGQAEGNNSDCILNPVAIYPDPIRGGQDVLVMCEVLNPDSTPHPTNTRAALAALIDSAVRKFFFSLFLKSFDFLHHFFRFFFCSIRLLPLFLSLPLPSFSPFSLTNIQVVAEAPLYGFEQEYTMLTNSGNVYGWPQGGYPAPQGPFYCGVGSTSVYGRPLAEAHMVRKRGEEEEGGSRLVRRFGHGTAELCEERGFCFFHSLILSPLFSTFLFPEPRKPPTPTNNRTPASRPASSSPASTPRSCPASGSSRSARSAPARSGTR